MSTVQPLAHSQVNSIQPIPRTHSTIKTIVANGTAAVIETAALATLAAYGLSLAKFAYSWGAWPLGIIAITAGSQFIDTYSRSENLSNSFNAAIQVPANLTEWTKSGYNWTKTKVSAVVGSGWNLITTFVKKKISNFDSVPAEGLQPILQIGAAVNINAEPQQQAEPRLVLDLVKDKTDRVWIYVKNQQSGLFKLAERFGANRKAILIGVGVGSTHLLYKHLSITNNGNPTELPTSILDNFFAQIASYYSYQLAAAAGGIAGLITGPKSNPNVVLDKFLAEMSTYCSYKFADVAHNITLMATDTQPEIAPVVNLRDQSLATGEDHKEEEKQFEAESTHGISTNVTSFSASHEIPLSSASEPALNRAHGSDVGSISASQRTEQQQKSSASSLSATHMEFVTSVERNTQT